MRSKISFTLLLPSQSFSMGSHCLPSTCARVGRPTDGFSTYEDGLVERQVDTPVFPFPCTLPP